MKAILINPYDQTVTEVDYSGDYKEIYTLIEADCFDCAGISRMDGIFVDDNGLLSNPTHFFMHEEYPNPLAGKGLVVGCDEGGDSVDCKTTVEEVRAKVRFGNIFDIRRQYAGV